MRARNPLVKVSAITVLVAGCLLIATVEPAFASTTCNAGSSYNPPYTLYNDGLYTGSASYRGIEGDISVETPTLNASNQPSINYVATSTAGVFQSPNYSCNVGQSGVCQIQAGEGVGTVGYYGVKFASTSSPEVYEENEDVNGYNVAFYSNLPLAQDDFYNNFFTGMTASNGSGLYDAYYSTNIYGSGATLIGQAWLPNYYGGVEEYNGEQDTFYTTETCPQVPPYEYFGTNGSGATTLMDLDQTGTWFAWTTSVSTGGIGGVAPYPAGYITPFQSLRYNGG